MIADQPTGPERMRHLALNSVNDYRDAIARYGAS